MKTYHKTMLLLIFLLTSISQSLAQTDSPKLDQVELMKQFIGTWRCELGKDTFLISMNTPFGTGMISKSEIVTNGTCLDSIIQLYGYDKNADKFIVAEQIKSSPVIEVCNAWFTSENAGELIIIDPDNAPYTFKFLFQSPDTLLQTGLKDGKVIKEIMGKRIK